MNKAFFMLAMAFFLSLGLIAANSYAAGNMGKSGFMTFNSRDLIGASVKDSHGEYVGIVDEVLVDSAGHAFAIINHGDYDLYGGSGVETPVPFEALRILQTKSGQDNVVFRLDAEHLDLAPYFDPAQRFDRQNEAAIYEYYGIQPYWTESAAAGKGKITGLDSLNLVGAAVENSCSKVTGIVDEVMVDSEGHAFAIINHGDYDLYGEDGVDTPVPVQELRISQTKAGQGMAFLKTDMEHFDFAPYFSPLQKFSRQDEAKIYEYYGIRPYWTESGE